jgi:hypothetical protein
LQFFGGQDGYTGRGYYKIEEKASLRKLRVGGSADWRGLSAEMYRLWTSGDDFPETGGKKYQKFEKRLVTGLFLCYHV